MYKDVKVLCRQLSADFLKCNMTSDSHTDTTLQRTTFILDLYLQLPTFQIFTKNQEHMLNRSNPDL